MTHDIETRDDIIAGLSGVIDVLHTEIRWLKARRTAAEERVAIVAWLRRMPAYQIYAPGYFADCIERNRHWPTEEKPT